MGRPLYQRELDVRPMNVGPWVFVKGSNAMYYIMSTTTDSIERMRRDYPGTKLEVVPWPERVKFR